MIRTTLSAILLLLIHAVYSVDSWNAVLTVSNQVSGAVAGEPFLNQPKVKVTDRDGVFHPSFQGMVHVKLSHSTDRKERLWKKSVVGFDDLGNTSVGNSSNVGVYSVHVVQGEAQFSLLYVNKAADNYRLKFLLTDTTGKSAAATYSEIFSVTIGEPYQIGIVNSPSTVLGSAPFQFSIAVQDKGFNTIKAANDGVVSVALENNINDLVILKSVSNTFTAPVVAGEALFDGLYIMKAGVSCKLIFITNLPLDGGTTCASSTFSVKVGNASSLDIENYVPATVTAGLPFVNQPRVCLVDAGKNILRNENSLTARVYFGRNPTEGSLLPVTHAVAPFRHGVAQFKHLFIDKAGQGYVLCFDLMEADGITKYNETEIVACGSKFEVTVGLPHTLQIVSHPLKTWAGNQPFVTQPILRLLDAGGNIVTTDSSTVAEAFLVPSLGQTTHIIVDTRDDDVPKIVEIKAVRANTMNKEFVPGDLISLKVEFSQEILVKLSERVIDVTTESPILPTIDLNIMNAVENVSSRAAYLVADYINSRTRYLFFEYHVVVGDFQEVLDNVAGSSINSHDYIISDLWMRAASLELPLPRTSGSLSFPKPISVDGTEPFIINILIPLESGEYGAGHEIPFNVAFSRKVSITGTPRLPIVVKSRIAILDTVAKGPIFEGSSFVIVYNGVRSEPISWNATAETVKAIIQNITSIKGHVCVSRSVSSSDIFGGYRWAVRFESPQDSLVNNMFEVDASGMLFSTSLGGDIALQFATVSAPLPNWTTEDGAEDSRMCTSRFAYYKVNNASDSIEFVYNILQGDESDRLDFYRSTTSEILLHPQDSSICLSTSDGGISPVQANISFGALTLPNNLIIKVDSSPPKIVDVQFQKSTTPDGVYFAGDILFIEVIFSKPVSVHGGVYMTLNTNPRVAIAKYESGSTTDTIVLRYFVEEGHMSSNLDYSGPYALSTTRIYSASVWRVATNVACEALLLLPGPPNSLAFRSNITIDGSKPKIIQVALEDRAEGHRYTLGDNIGIIVHFSSEVLLVGVSPVLNLVVGGKERVAHCSSKEFPSSSLKFVYKVLLGDTASHDTFCYKYDAATALCSNPSCLEEKRIDRGIFKYTTNATQRADLTMSLFNGTSAKGVPFVADPNFLIETSYNVPQTTIVSITVLNGPGTLTRGDELTVSVRFADVVFCIGKHPRLSLNIGGSIGIEYAYGSGTDSIVFQYIIDNEVSTDSLIWVLIPGSNTSISCDAESSPPCFIENSNGDVVDLSFVNRRGDNIVNQFDGSVRVNQEVPRITSVYTNKEPSYECQRYSSAANPYSCTYGAGEEFTIFVSFNLPIVVLGGLDSSPSLLLDNGRFDGGVYGRHLIYNATLSNDFNLAFDYRVLPKESSMGRSLSYVCVPDKCRLGSIASDTEPQIFRKSSHPTILVDLSLPSPPKQSASITATHRIIVETESTPRILNVTALTGDGVYFPGDKVEILVYFDKAVSVHGCPWLNLNVGQEIDGTAWFTDGDGTRVLSFVYFVDIGHKTRRLDYVDSYSLELGMDGWIKQRSTHPSTEANLELPAPGLPGSLSASSNVEIDSRTPYIASVSSPNSGLHRTGSLITINVRFSSSVVVSGSPFLLLETGAIDRRALFVGMAGPDTLVFRYEVQLGDYSPRLDYWTSQGLVRISAPAFDFFGDGYIKKLSLKPMVSADLHLNPASGYLDGTRRRRFNEGVVEYSDLVIAQRGVGYKLRFWAIPPSTSWPLESESVINVTESSEYEIRETTGYSYKGNHFGRSVAIDGSLIVVGSPHTRHYIPAIQVLTVFAESETVVPEVQVFGTKIDSYYAAITTQSFSTTAYKGETVGGSFSISYVTDKGYMYGSPVIVSCDIGPLQLKSLLQRYFPILAPLEVTRVANTECMCKNAWKWSISRSVLDSTSVIQLFITDGHGLFGEGAAVSAAQLERVPDLLRGSFAIVNPYTGVRSREIAFDASAAFVKAAIENDLEIRVLHVRDFNKNNNMPSLGRTWTVTFGDYIGPFGSDFNVPNLDVTYENLTGFGSMAWSHVASEGRGPLSGKFALSLRGSQFSHFIPYNASAEMVQSAIEELESVNRVTVSPRESLSGESRVYGFRWKITFDSVNRMTEYGWLTDLDSEGNSDNLPPLLIRSQLVGWNSAFKVDSESGESDAQVEWRGQRKESSGINTGKAYVFSRHGDHWISEASLIAQDYHSHDEFGHSVDLLSSRVIIGSPSKLVEGQYEQQALTCYGPASGGYFTISFRGFQSDPIFYNATVQEIHDSIVGEYGSTNKVHSISALNIDESSNWSEGGFCTSLQRQVLITFVAPDGSGISTMTNKSGDFELLTVDDSSLVDASVNVTESQKGSRSPLGINLQGNGPTGKQSGSVYIFHQMASCDPLPCTYSWSQEAMLSPLDAGEFTLDSARFGWSVSLSKIDSSFIAVVGSPGWNEDAGKVYVFYNLSNTWSSAEILTEKPWNSVNPGNEFGYAVAAESSFIFVGAPGYNGGDGAVYIFQRSRSGRFLASQRLVTGSSGGRFGHSLAIRKDASEFVVCSPQEAFGKCYVYLQNTMGDFRLSQVLSPSNVKLRDRFGWSCAISEMDVILIGQLELFDLTSLPERPVQDVRTYTNSSDCLESLGGFFQLSWKAENNSLHTKDLPADATSHIVRKALEQDLKCGSVNVTRSKASDKCGGYTWSITFNNADSYRLQGNGIPVLGCSADKLSGTAPRCSVNVASDVAKKLRSKAHVFKKQKNGVWKEQAFLFPYLVQRQDWFGYSVALDGYNGVVGAPNRDFLNVNGGASFVYDLRFVSLSFGAGLYNGIEGESIEVKLHRENPSSLGPQVIGLVTVARNAFDEVQTYVNNLYSIRSEELFPPGETSIDLLYFSTAFGRPDGNTLWVDGMYDYRAISDYKSIDDEIVWDQNQSSASILIATTNDQTLEKPDENITVQLSLPGMFPSILGDLITTINLQDNNNGSEYYDKLFGEDTSEADRFGSAVDILSSPSIMIIGAEWASGLDDKNNTVVNAGKAYVFTKNSSGKWLQTSTLSPDYNNVAAGGRFGASVSISKPYGRDDITALVGSPGLGKAFIFSFVVRKGIWQLQGELTHSDLGLLAAPSAAMFGEKNSVKILGDVAFVGAAGMETVFVFRRTFGSDQNSVMWALWLYLRSSDFDYDLYDNGFTVQHVHKQHFGFSIAAFGRTLMVGAPFSDYGNRGNVLIREFSNTDGIDNEGLGKGNVYVFQSTPHVQLVTLSYNENVSPGIGSFRLQLPPSVTLSGMIKCDADEYSFKMALEEVANIGEISVRRIDEISGNIRLRNWWISFISKVDDFVPLLKPLWHDFGCTDCEPFMFPPYSASSAPFIKVRRGGIQQEYLETQKLQGADVSIGDSFGYSLNMDGPLAIIGAVHSSVLTRTTWGFESGNLMGWAATGHAFDFQPTYGDNSRQRWVYGGFGNPELYTKGQPQSCSMKGRYYIGTFERRPGWQVNYVEPHPLFPPGDSVGDEPTGTLTSDPFVILGSTISFLIGGGCDHLTVYVELLVDGFPSMRATGRCSEQMLTHVWDVSDFLFRSGQIRIVDFGSGEWGHINVDEFMFSWNEEGTCANSFGGSCNAGGGYGSRTYGNPAKQIYTGKDETPSAGSAYIFIQRCKSDEFICLWEEQTRIVSSDKRARNMLGFSVAIDHDSGIAVVGSVHSPAYGFYNEIPSEYPHRNATPVKFPVSPKLENYQKAGDSYAASGGSLRLIDHMQRMQDADQLHTTKIQVLDVPVFAEKAGAVYLFKRFSPEKGIGGENIKDSFWLNTEHGRVAPPDVVARDEFGYSLALDGDTAVIGAIGVDGVGNNGGASYVIKMSWRNIRFVKSEYVALEGGTPTNEVKVLVERYASNISEEERIGFSTSDLSAEGVDPDVFALCRALPIDQRCGAHCGDYERTSGELIFATGEKLNSFRIKIMDDTCHEPEMEYIQIQLHIPGGGPIHGEDYRAHVRIDDNDWIVTNN